jgi:hypothetical protein
MLIDGFFVPTVGYLLLMSGSRQALAFNEWTSQCPKVTGTHPMFYNRRSSVVPSRVLHYAKFGCLIPCFVIGEAWLQPKKKKKKGSGHGWGLFENVWERGGGWCGPGSTTVWPYFRNATTRTHKWFWMTRSQVPYRPTWGSKYATMRKPLELGAAP